MIRETLPSDTIRGGCRFSDKIMLKQEAKANTEST